LPFAGRGVPGGISEEHNGRNLMTLTSPSDRVLDLVQRDLDERVELAHRAPFAGMDRDGMPPRVELASTERRGLLGIAPRRSMWPELDALDARVSDLQRRQGEAFEQLRALTEQRTAAPALDADALAAWELGGRKGRRPDSLAETLGQEISAAERERDGLQRAVDLALEEKASFVERHRARLASVAGQQAERAHARMRELVDELEVTRATLIDLRSAEVWASLYPDAHAGQVPPVATIALGHAKPVTETLGLRPAPAFPAAGILELLRRDADLLLTTATAEQRALLGDGEQAASGAEWTEAPEAKSARAIEMQQLVDAATRELGHAPTEIEFEAYMRETMGAR
jgi:hypothetical protein